MSRAKKHEKNRPMDELVKVLAGFSPDTPDETVRQYRDQEFPHEIERPCGILSWCPYGVLVEQIVLMGSDSSGYYPRVEPMRCGVFGFDCPAFYMVEPFADLDAIAENRLRADCEAKCGTDVPDLTPAEARRSCPREPGCR